VHEIETNPALVFRISTASDHLRVLGRRKVRVRRATAFERVCVVCRVQVKFLRVWAADGRQKTTTVRLGEREYTRGFAGRAGRERLLRH
jgi:hypothetical protein